ncbi:hypothetical protein F4677DRAFT_447555 [Hypoxylon crocopeplum]|nr:hypothetical protein F4677DRAFT_447555 [Hypoxylon crocopeplum]
MRTSSLITLALALCGAALAVPSPTRIVKSLPNPVVRPAAEDSPDCDSIKEYCKCTDDDFQCETNPNCEWCREHAWGEQ